MQAQDKDTYGNFIMKLDSIGITNSVRFAHVDNTIKFSELDVVKAVVNKSSDYCSQIIRRLSEEVQSEVRANCTELKFKGVGQKESTLITFQGVLKLIMALPGINAREMRTKFATVLQEVMFDLVYEM